MLMIYCTIFRPGHSTVTQLIEIYHNVCLALENKELSLSCFTFCDISKAFDRVWIKGLIFKLEKYGFLGQILSWLKSYPGYQIIYRKELKR